MPQDLADHLNSNATPPGAASGSSGPVDQQQRLRSVGALLKQVGEAKLLFDVSGNVVFASGATANLLGVTPDSMANLPASALTFAAGQVASVAGQAMGTSNFGVIDGVLTLPDGQRVGASIRTSPMVENGTLLGVGVTVTDGATRRVVEASLKGDLPAALKAAVHASVGVFFLDARGNCMTTAGTFAEHTGIEANAAQGQGWLSMVAPAVVDDLRRIAVVAHRNKDGWRTQVPHATKPVTLDIATAPVTDPADNVVGYVGMVTSTPTAPVVEPAEIIGGQVPASSWVVPTAPAAPASAPSVAPAVPEAPKTIVETIASLPIAAVSTPPIEPVERYRLKETPQSWVPPKLEEGFTDASRLVPQAPVVADDAPPIPTEPGTDKVTGLPNKVLFAQHVQATIERIKSDALTVAISFIDLAGIRTQREQNGRRNANDSLFLLAKRLESTIRSIEIAGAISEDIFAVLSINWLFAEDLPIVCRRLLGRLQEPLAGRNGEYVVDMKLGMSVARSDDTVESLFARAAETLQKAKSSPEQYIIQGM